jgi:hypothetical protein
VHERIYQFQSLLPVEPINDPINLSPMKWRYLILLLGGCALAGAGIVSWKTHLQFWQFRSFASSGNTRSILLHDITPCAIALAPHKGDEEIDREIMRLQNEARSNSERADTMKRLGWAFIAKARLSYDPGYYKLSEQCALCVRSKNDDDPDALLLQGHILQSLATRNRRRGPIPAWAFMNCKPVIQRLP